MLKNLTENDPRTSGTEEVQVSNYLKATGHETGLLINFGTALNIAVLFLQNR